MHHPLDGIRVVDLCSNLAGPYCGQILADMGADVIKVERPGTGDPSRAWAPPAWGGEGTLFLSSNRGKRSLALELGTDDAQEILHRLLDTADVAIQAFRPDVARRFGLTEEALRPRHPSLVFCSITAFDPGGPHAERPGYDPLLQAHSGLMSMTGPPQGPPVRVGTSIVDMGAGMWAAIGILGALRTREATGRGHHLRISLEDTALAWGAYHLQGTLASGRAPKPMGTGLGMIVPYGAFPTGDGHLMIAAGTDALFQALCRALGLEGLAEDPRLATNPGRVAHRAEVEGALARATRRLTVKALESALSSAGVPCSRVRDYGEVASDPHVLGGIFRREAHPEIPDYRAVGPPVVTDGERPEAGRPPPSVGEHTAEILEELARGPASGP
ncbi:MAG: CoA transferase [Gemmatimonadales bacterium]|nr:MAG: CoA transferase [Gemmatimonadales bacterium]